jgi:hypothetical protein
MSNNNIPYPKMSRKQAKMFWNSLTPVQRSDFNHLVSKLLGEELILTKVNVTDDEKITSIILEDKNKPGKPIKPFAKHFHLKD